MSQTWAVEEIIPGSTAPATDITKLTDALASLKSNFIGASLPVANLVAGMFAIDTADDLYVRNSANDGWVLIGNIEAVRLGAAALNGDPTKTFSAAAGTTTNQAVNYGQVFGIPRTIQKFTSGSGTYTKPAGCVAIKVRMVGGGGGGSGSGTSGQTIGGNGGTSTFGTSLLTALGGSGGYGSSPGVGQTATVSSPAMGFGKTGSDGNGAMYVHVTGTNIVGGEGGASPFGGAGAGVPSGNGRSGADNSGSGGAGGGSSWPSSGVSGGAGGGSSGYVDALIVNPSATYSYAIGAAGSIGSAGAGGYNGGAGGSGFIIVEEYYV